MARPHLLEETTPRHAKAHATRRVRRIADGYDMAAERVVLGKRCMCLVDADRNALARQHGCECCSVADRMPTVTVLPNRRALGRANRANAGPQVRDTDDIDGAPDLLSEERRHHGAAPRPELEYRGVAAGRQLCSAPGYDGACQPEDKHRM